jgi:hypothetical protein
MRFEVEAGFQGKKKSSRPGIGITPNSTASLLLIMYIMLNYEENDMSGGI